MEIVYEGTWEEVAAHAPELAGRQVRLIVEEPSEEARRLDQMVRLERGIAMVRELGKDLPPYPKRELTLDVFYPDEDEPR